MVGLIRARLDMTDMLNKMLNGDEDGDTVKRMAAAKYFSREPWISSEAIRQSWIFLAIVEATVGPSTLGILGSSIRRSVVKLVRA